MQAHTRKRHTDSDLVPLNFFVHPVNVDKIIHAVNEIESLGVNDDFISAEEFLNKYFPGQSSGSVALRGYRLREDLTQRQLSESAGIPQRHISEMENGKRSIGKEVAKKLSFVLKCDYRRLL